MSRRSISSKSETDWQRLDAMTDEDIDLSDCPEIPPEKFAKAVVRHGLPVDENKAQVTLRIDSDVLEWKHPHEAISRSRVSQAHPVTCNLL